MIRFDSKALYDAIDAQRKKKNMTWKEVAREIGIAESTITRTRNGGRLEVDGMIAMVSWLGVPAETFTRNDTPQQ